MHGSYFLVLNAVGQRCSSLEPRRGKQPNGTLNCCGGCHPSGPLGLHTPVRRGCRSSTAQGWGVVESAVLPRLSGNLPAKPGLALSGLRLDMRPLQPSPASNTHHGQARPRPVDEVTRCQPELGGCLMAASRPVDGSRHRETLTGKLETHKIQSAHTTARAPSCAARTLRSVSPPCHHPVTVLNWYDP